MRAYIETKDHNGETGRGRKTCKFYRELDEILGHMPASTPLDPETNGNDPSAIIYNIYLILIMQMEVMFTQIHLTTRRTSQKVFQAALARVKNLWMKQVCTCKDYNYTLTTIPLCKCTQHTV